jgi:tetratricopeptide (TPR) repeat protein
LYDRYGSLEHAEEAFSAVMKMDQKFEKANEIYFRLGIIYKQQQKYDLSLQVSQKTKKNKKEGLPSCFNRCKVL